MALSVAGQADFGAGIYRGRESPDNAAYDLLNCLIDDEGQPFRRGGSEYLSTGNASAALTGLASALLAVGQRTIMSIASGLVVLDGSNTPVTVISGTASEAPGPLQRWANVGGILFTPSADQNFIVLYAGALTSGSSTAGSASVSNGSTGVGGAGSSFTTAGAGWLFGSGLSGGDEYLGIVASVANNTSLTLTEPWAYPTLAAASYGLKAVWGLSLTVAGAEGPKAYVASAGTPPRLFFSQGKLIVYSKPGQPWMFDRAVANQVASYHVTPDGSTVTGLQGFGDSLLVFTTSGVFHLENTNYDAIDDVGNVQQAIRQLSEMILWHDSGIASWRGVPVVPCIDDVVLMPLGEAPVSITGTDEDVRIRPLYRAYVQAGYRPGIAAVHRGHYFLPIVNGTTLIDMLVCRLDRGFAWTRWAGHGAGIAYAQQVGSATRSPKLFSIAGLRVTELSDAWNPSASNAAEADASVHALLIDTRDYPTPAGRLGSTTKQLRIRYEATAAGAVSVTAKFSRGPEGSAYTSLTNLRGGATADGLDESVWAVVKKAPAIRFRLESASALSSFVLRSVEARYTESGAQ